MQFKTWAPILRSQNLDVWANVHTGQKKFNCEMCCPSFPLFLAIWSLEFLEIGDLAWKNDTFVNRGLGIVKENLYQEWAQSTEENFEMFPGEDWIFYCQEK